MKVCWEIKHPTKEDDLIFRIMDFQFLCSNICIRSWSDTTELAILNMISMIKGCWLQESIKTRVSCDGVISNPWKFTDCCVRIYKSRDFYGFLFVNVLLSFDGFSLFAWHCHFFPELSFASILYFKLINRNHWLLFKIQLDYICETH